MTFIFKISTNAACNCNVHCTPLGFGQAARTYQLLTANPLQHFTGCNAKEHPTVQQPGRAAHVRCTTIEKREIAQNCTHSARTILYVSNSIDF